MEIWTFVPGDAASRYSFSTFVSTETVWFSGKMELFFLQEFSEYRKCLFQCIFPNWNAAQFPSCFATETLSMFSLLFTNMVEFRKFLVKETFPGAGYFPNSLPQEHCVFFLSFHEFAEFGTFLVQELSQIGNSLFLSRLFCRMRTSCFLSFHSSKWKRLNNWSQPISLPIKLFSCLLFNTL